TVSTSQQASCTDMHCVYIRQSRQCRFHLIDHAADQCQGTFLIPCFRCSPTHAAQYGQSAYLLSCMCDLVSGGFLSVPPKPCTALIWNLNTARGIFVGAL
ncbi:hypothetical protein ABVT39_009447, partial [Epinephelus coioides]